MLFYWIYHSSTLAAAIRIAFRFGFMRRLSSEMSKKFPFHRPAFAIFAIAIYKQINDDRTKNVQKWICWLQKSSSSNWKEWNVPCSYFRISHLFSSNSIFLFSFAISFIAFWRTHKKKCSVIFLLLIRCLTVLTLAEARFIVVAVIIWQRSMCLFEGNVNE